MSLRFREDMHESNYGFNHELRVISAIWNKETVGPIESILYTKSYIYEDRIHAQHAY